MVKQIDMIKCKVEFLKQFDYYVKNIIGDEEITEFWLRFGLPDDFDESDLHEIAVDNELWTDTVDTFSKCCNMAGVI
jgi:hypothetical protein